MIPTLSTLLKTIAGKTILGLAVVSMGVGAAAAAGPHVFPPSDTHDDVQEEVVEQKADDAVDADDEEEAEEAEDAAEEAAEAAHAEDEGSEEEGSEAKGPQEEGSEEEGLEAKCPQDEVIAVETPDWKVVKTECRDAWHDMRDENQAEWLEAKDVFNELCGDDDDDDSAESAEGQAEADVEMVEECRALKAELRDLKEMGKSEWKDARDEAKEVWKAAKDEAKADQRAERDEAKAARDEAKAARASEHGK